MTINLLAIIFFMSGNIFATPSSIYMESYEKRREEYQVNLRYRAGNSLIYDCRRSYFLCTNEEGRSACEEARDLDQKNPYETKYRCAFFKTFPTKEVCVENQNKMMEKETRKFCRK